MSSVTRSRLSPACDQPARPERPLRCRRHTLELIERDDPQRQDAERFVQHMFAARHRAQIHSFMPTLLTLRGSEERICGVVGFRNAGAERLFLESYLEQPVEAVLSAHVHETVAREHIAEIGNLASSSCRAAFQLVALLPKLLLDRGNRWVVFTATRTVREILTQFGAPLLELAPASRECLNEAQDDWGRYYDADPRVMAGYLPDGLSLRLVRSSDR